jgi:WD40 repeat protein/energy-coupling factor transporter ATP-binding protein EcfA2
MHHELRESQAHAGDVPSAFDVFLSHNGRDKPVVERIALRLRDAGLEPWLDIWHLTPGGRWQEELAEGLAASRACAVFIGSHDLGNWELQELGVALNRAAKERDFRLFPVLLPGLSEPFDPSALPPFLATRTWVDFREGWDEERRFQGLVNAVRGVPLGPTQPAGRADDRPPYRGLETFDEEHADLFFGREGDVQRLLEKLKASRFLAVLGPSGSGKSSLVRAGLLPALRRGAVPGSETWQICLLRPGARPLTALAAQLAHVVPGGAMQRTLDGLTADERTLHLAVALALAETAPSARVVVVVDQLEEAFTLARDDTERERFLANLVYAASVPDGQAIVVTTMRADFYPRLAAYPEMAQLTAAHQALVAPLDEEGLRQAIEEPARRVGLVLEEGLVDTILEDVEHQSGALPLLEHALLELWRRRRGTMLTLEAYRETGGVGGALARRADGVFTSFTREQQEVARRTFLRLTQPGEGTEDTRRRARLDELASSPADSEEVDGVVRALVDARMLTTGGGGGEQWVDVSHEALIRGWPRLRRWLDDDRTGLRVHRRLTEATEEWGRLDRDAGTLYRGARLAEAVEWRRRNEDVLNPLERDFLDASAALAKREQRQAQRRIRWTIGGMAAALLLIGAGALVAVQQRGVAADQRDEAVSSANVARSSNIVERDPIAAVRLALDAVHAKRTPDATRALRQAVGAARLRKTLVANGSPLWAADATADGTRAISASDDGGVRIWDLKSGRVVRVLRGHRGAVHAADLSRDGRLVVTGGDDETVRIWDASTGKQVRVLGGQLGPVHAAAFSPDGALVVSGGVDRVARVWRTGDGRLLHALRSHRAWIEDAAFSRDGREFATAGGDSTTRIWDTATGRPLGAIRTSSFGASVAFGPRGLVATGDDSGLVRVRGAASTVLRGHADTVWDLDFDEDGRLLASASGDRSARVWELATGQTIATLGPHPSVAVSARFTDRGRLLLTAERDGAARLWAVEAERRLAVLPAGSGTIDAIAVAAETGDVATAGADGTVRVWTEKGRARLRFDARSHVGAVAISSDGGTIVAACDDGTVRLWRDGLPGKVIGRHEGAARAAAFSPDGRTLATSGVDHRVQLWDVDAGERVGVLPGAASVEGVAFSPDGQVLASADADGLLDVWNVRARRLEFALRWPRQSFRSVAFAPDGRIAVGTDAGAVRLADIERRDWGLPSDAHTSPVEGLAFAPDGATFVTASVDGDARIWDASRVAPVARLRPTGGPLIGAAVLPDGHLVVAGRRAAFVYGCDTCRDGSELDEVAEGRLSAAK